jgi:tRNA-Thr(GGU) m(6)t(6)A37 methyltransferase TsaA
VKVEKAEGRTRLRVAARYAPALLGLDGFSHVHVRWWFDKNDSPEKRGILQVHPRGDSANPLTGVFATRAPVRPNLIATTLCRIVRIRDNVIDVEDIDAFDGTPILDLKPYIPRSDCAEDGVRTPHWL